VTEVSRGFSQFRQGNAGVLPPDITTSYHPIRQFRLIRPIYDHSITRR